MSLEKIHSEFIAKSNESSNSSLNGSYNTIDNRYIPENILITGGLGFIASHLVIQLVKLFKYNIVVLDKYDVCASMNNLSSVADKVKIIIGDINSKNLVNFILREYKIDTIIHLAAQTHVDNSFGNSIAFTKNNVMGTHVLLEASHHAKNRIKRFIHVSTDEVYGETNEKMKENMVLSPTNPYAATKAAAEFLVKSYHKSFGLPIIITRGNNVYGPHQYPEKLIPKFINLLMRNEPCCIHGDGSNRRSFLYVTDVAKAFILLLHRGIIGETYNIGTDFEITNLDVARDLIKLMNKNEKLIEYVEDRKFNDSRYQINTDKLDKLGWKPEVDWQTGLKHTINWYIENKNNWPSIEHVLVAHPK